MKCFDKLFLHDTIIDLFDANLNNDHLVLLYKENEENSVSIRSPFGMTDRFMIKDVVMQGTKFAPLQCTTSMSKLGADAYRNGKPLLTYKDTVKIPAMGMIDDVATASECGVDTVISNAVTNSFIESKRLTLGEKKSNRMHIGRRKDQKECLPLKVHENKMNDSQKEKYVGDVITDDGKNNENIAARKGKGFGITGDIVAMLKEIPFGPYKIQAGLCMRDAMLINGMLNNSETWYGLTYLGVTTRLASTPRNRSPNPP